MSKCSICKKSFEEEYKKDGQMYKTCQNCRNRDKLAKKRNKCEHGRDRYGCRLCKGAGICDHGRMRLNCKDCGGAGICEHNRHRSSCRDCNCEKVCDHGEKKYECQECRDRRLCPHKRQKNYCKECGGKSMCEHGRIRGQCKDCGGKQICEHNRIRTHCKDCQGASICEHQRQRHACKDCKGASICVHLHQKTQCRECGGSVFCPHDRRKDHCIICTPKRACKNCMSVGVPPSYRFHPFCFRCYCVLNPDAEISKKYKLKEHYLRDVLKEEFKDVEMVFDKICGESRRRPDVLIKCDTHSVVIEVDEEQHKKYECEDKRMMEIFRDLGSKPIVMIRFNPDSYTEKSGVKIPSCFKMTKTAGYTADKREWERRSSEVIKSVKHFLSNPPEKEVFLVRLFYDED